jgi:hypothetical protein
MILFFVVTQNCKPSETQYDSPDKPLFDDAAASNDCSSPYYTNFRLDVRAKSLPPHPSDF